MRGCLFAASSRGDGYGDRPRHRFVLWSCKGVVGVSVCLSGAVLSWMCLSLSLVLRRRGVCVHPGRPFVEVAVVPPVYRIVCVHPLARRSSRGLSRTPLWVGTSRSAVAGLPMLRGDCILFRGT